MPVNDLKDLLGNALGLDFSNVALLRAGCMRKASVGTRYRMHGLKKGKAMQRVPSFSMTVHLSAVSVAERSLQKLCFCTWSSSAEKNQDKSLLAQSEHNCASGSRLHIAP